MSTESSPRTSYPSNRDREGNRRPGGSPHYARQSGPLQLTLTIALVVSLALLLMSSITRYTMGDPVLPTWLAKALHRPQAALPAGMTYDFEVISPETKRPLAEIPEVGTIEMRLAVTNDSALPITMHFAKGQQAEFIVRRVLSYGGGLFALPLEVWRSSYFQRAAGNASTLTLDPGQTKVYSASFDLTALNARLTPPGDYRVMASFNGWETSIHIPKPL